MSTLYLDSGAERMGWAILNAPKVYEASGIFACPRGDQEFQPYRLNLEKQVTLWFLDLIRDYFIDTVINETIPAKGFGNYAQSYLANSAVSVIHCLAYLNDITVGQYSANTVKVAIGGHNKATKVGVRNGVFALLPELEYRKPDWVKIFDEPDAIALGLAHLGHRNPKIKKAKK